MFVDNIGAKPTPLKGFKTSHTNQSAEIANFSTDVNMKKAAKTDNIQLPEQDKPTEKPSTNFSHTFVKKIMTDTSQNAEAEKKIKKQAQNPELLSKMLHSAKSLMIQEVSAQPVALDKTASAKTKNLQQQVENLNPDKAARLTTPHPQKTILFDKPVKPIITNLNQIGSATRKPIDKPLQSPIDQGQIKSGSILPTDSESLLIANAQSEKTIAGIQSKNGSDIKKQQESNKESSESPKIPEKIKTTTSSIFTSNRQNHRGDKELTSHTLVDSEKSAVIKNPALKTQISNDTFTAQADKSSNPQQKVLFTSQSLKPITEEPKTEKADTSQKDHQSNTEHSELPKKNTVPINHLSAKFISQKMSRQKVRSSAPHMEINSNLLSKQQSNPDTNLSEQVIAGGNLQTQVTESSPVSATFAKITVYDNSSNTISNQLQESIQSSFQSGNHQIVIRLNPPELGKVAIKFAEQGDNITGLLQVDKPQTKEQIQQAIPELIQNLQDSGIQIKRFEVVLTNQQEQYTSKDQSSTAAQDGWSGQQGSPNPESPRNNTNYNEWLPNIDSTLEFAETQAVFAGSSINMLA